MRGNPNTSTTSNNNGTNSNINNIRHGSGVVATSNVSGRSSSSSTSLSQSNSLQQPQHQQQPQQQQQQQQQQMRSQHQQQQQIRGQQQQQQQQRPASPPSATLDSAKTVPYNQQNQRQHYGSPTSSTTTAPNQPFSSYATSRQQMQQQQQRGSSAAAVASSSYSDVGTSIVNSMSNGSTTIGVAGGNTGGAARSKSVVGVPMTPSSAAGTSTSTSSSVGISSSHRRIIHSGTSAAVPSSSLSSSNTIQQQQQQQKNLLPPPPPPPVQQQQQHQQQQFLQQQQQHSFLPQHHNQYQHTSNNINNNMISVESPLPTSIQRGLGDRSNEKRKNAALEIELLIKQESTNFPFIASVITVLSKDFCTSMNSNYRKGGLVGLAATAIGLLGNAPAYLQALLPPVLHCFDDPESRVRYYACEALYNIAKVSRQSILKLYFTPIFDGLAKLYADVDVDVKNGANLLDRLIKDIVTEAGDEGTFHIDQFLPLLQNYIRRTNPYIRQLIVGWITLLDSIPDISMLDYLPDFLDGLFNMLSDTNREIRQAADSALSDFLRELSVSTVLEFGPIISILVCQSNSKERLNRLTAITWLAELTHHPRSGGDALLAYHADVLGAIMCCISDDEKEIRLVAERTNDDLLVLVKEQTNASFALHPILETLISELLNKPDVPTKMASLRWINMLMEKRQSDMNVFTNQLLPVLLKTLSDPSDTVILLTLQVLSRISLSKKPILDITTANNNNNDDTITVDDPFDASNRPDKSKETNSSRNTSPVKNVKANKVRLDNTNSNDVVNTDIMTEPETELQCQLVLTAILKLFGQDRKLLETRGSLIIRKLCVLLNARSVYIIMSNTLASYEVSTVDGTSKNNMNGTMLPTPTKMTSTLPVSADYQNSSLEFISTMVQTMNLILLTASELHDLRSVLAISFETEYDIDLNLSKTPTSKRNATTPTNTTNVPSPAESTPSTLLMNDCSVFATLYHCWCHNPVATFSLCLLARAYDLAFALVQKFSDMDDVNVGFLMQIDKLVHLLESPIFIHLRLQLLNVDATYHEPLLKSIYGVLMCLPQGDAYRLLNDRLATVCNLRDSLSGGNSSSSGVSGGNNTTTYSNGGNNFTFPGGRGYDPNIESYNNDSSSQSNTTTIVGKKGLDMKKLLDRYDIVFQQHNDAKNRRFLLSTTNSLDTSLSYQPHQPQQLQQHQQQFKGGNSTSFESSSKQQDIIHITTTTNSTTNVHMPHPADYLLSPSSNNQSSGTSRISDQQIQQQQQQQLLLQHPQRTSGNTTANSIIADDNQSDVPTTTTDVQIISATMRNVPSNIPLPSTVVATNRKY